MPATWSLDTDTFYKNVLQVKKDTPVMAVVKNNAYHFGLTYAVETFWRAGIDTFSTTSLKEAIRIRQICPTAHIFLMNPVRDFDALRQYNIQMTLPSMAFYNTNCEALYDIDVHIEYENLLHRSGFESLEAILTLLQAHAENDASRMNVRGLWTHFGYADEFDVDDYNVEKEAWLHIVDALTRRGYHFPFIHAQNSASYYRESGCFPGHTHARLGIALYGARPYADVDPTEIVQSLTVSAHVIQVRHVQPGSHCGYSFTFKVEKPNTKLAVVDIGYGDGILRTRAQHDVLIHGKRYPIRGLMMSHMFVEVDDNVHAEDEVILYNNDIRIDEFTFKGVGANSEQLSAMNHDALTKEYK